MHACIGTCIRYVVPMYVCVCTYLTYGEYLLQFSCSVANFRTAAEAAHGSERNADRPSSSTSNSFPFEPFSLSLFLLIPKHQHHHLSLSLFFIWHWRETLTPAPRWELWERWKWPIEHRELLVSMSSSSGESYHHHHRRRRSSVSEFEGEVEDVTQMKIYFQIDKKLSTFIILLFLLSSSSSSSWRRRRRKKRTVSRHKKVTFQDFHKKRLASA